MLDWMKREMPLAAVIGGCGGMGLACVRRLAQQHAVVLADIDPAKAATIADALGAEGHSVLPLACDVTDPASVADLFARVAAIAPLQTLAHVVGLSPSMAGWARVMDVNLPGAARVADAALPAMARGGAAIFVASLAAHAPAPDQAMLDILDVPLADGLNAAVAGALGREPTSADAYRLSKLGLVRMCRRLSPAWGLRGARIVSLSPGLIRTPMGDLEFKGSPQKQGLLDRTPLGRQGTLDEICDALEFLASDRASFISGTDLLVDGGVAAAGEFPRGG